MNNKISIKFDKAKITMHSEGWIQTLRCWLTKLFYPSDVSITIDIDKVTGIDGQPEIESKKIIVKQVKLPGRHEYVVIKTFNTTKPRIGEYFGIARLNNLIASGINVEIGK